MWNNAVIIKHNTKFRLTPAKMYSRVRSRVYKQHPLKVYSRPWNRIYLIQNLYNSNCILRMT